MALYGVSAVLFLVIDAVMLTFLMTPLFTRHLGDIMRDSVMLAPAGLFSLADGSYEFTSMSIMKNGSWVMVATGTI